MRVCLQCACLPSDRTRTGTISPGAQPAVGSTKCPSWLSRASSRQLQGRCSRRRGPEADQPVRRGLTRPEQQRQSNGKVNPSLPSPNHTIPIVRAQAGDRASRHFPVWATATLSPQLPRAAQSWKHLQLVSGHGWEDGSQNPGLRSSTAHEFSPPRVATPRSPNLRHSCAPRLLS